jgi:hypothetical protein
MHRSIFRLSRPLKAVVYLSFLALLVTGVVFLYAQPRIEEEAWEKVPRQMLKIHGGAAMIALMVLGAVSLHVKRGWKAKKNRLSGVLLLAVNAFLIVTGYGLYYAGDEAWREWMSRWHGWIGLGTFVLLPAHVLAGRIIMKRWQRRKHPDAPGHAFRTHILEPAVRWGSAKLTGSCLRRRPARICALLRTPCPP